MIKKFTCKKYKDDDYLQIEINYVSKETYLTVYENRKCSIQASIILNEEYIDEIISILKKAKKSIKNES